jgi:hypothetical protein
MRHFAHRRSERRTEAQHLLTTSGSGGQQGEGLVVVQSGEFGPESGQQRKAAVSAPFGVDRNASGGQRLEVAQHGPRGDLQLAGQRVRGQTTTQQQQQHQRDQPVGAHRRKLSNTCLRMS